MNNTELEFRAKKNLYKNIERNLGKMGPGVDIAFDIAQAFLGKKAA